MRNTPLALHVQAVGRALPAGLISPENLLRIQQSIRGVPAALASLFGFECRLKDTGAATDTDILFAANIETGGRDILAGKHPIASLPAGIWLDSVWNQIAAFSRQWNDVSSALYRGADDVWFEFDVGPNAPNAPNAEDAVPAPSFFFGPRVAHLKAAGDDAIRQTGNILREGFAALCGDSLPAETLACLDECLLSLPQHARIFQTGMMLSRGDRQIRICIDNLSIPETLRFVTQHRSQTEADGLAGLIRQLESTVASIKLVVDIDSRVGPRLGLECSAIPPQGEVAPMRWQPLLDLLVEQGECIAAKRNALLAPARLGQRWRYKRAVAGRDGGPVSIGWPGIGISVAASPHQTNLRSRTNDPRQGLHCSSETVDSLRP